MPYSNNSLYPGVIFNLDREIQSPTSGWGRPYNPDNNPATFWGGSNGPFNPNQQLPQIQHAIDFIPKDPTFHPTPDAPQVILPANSFCVQTPAELQEFLQYAVDMQNWEKLTNIWESNGRIGPRPPRPSPPTWVSRCVYMETYLGEGYPPPVPPPSIAGPGDIINPPSPPIRFRPFGGRPDSNLVGGGVGSLVLEGLCVNIILNLFKKLLEDKGQNLFPFFRGLGYSNEQIREIIKVLSAEPGILGGGPGTLRYEEVLEDVYNRILKNWTKINCNNYQSQEARAFCSQMKKAALCYNANIMKTCHQRVQEYKDILASVKKEIEKQKEYFCNGKKWIEEKLMEYRCKPSCNTDSCCQKLNEAFRTISYFCNVPMLSKCIKDIETLIKEIEKTCPTKGTLQEGDPWDIKSRKFFDQKFIEALDCLENGPEAKAVNLAILSFVNLQNDIKNICKDRTVSSGRSRK